MRDDKQTTNEQTLKIELLSQWKLEAEFRNIRESFQDMASQEIFDTVALTLTVAILPSNCLILPSL